MNYKPLPVGYENFSEIIDQGYYYVDKTLFIRELMDKKAKVNLYTRPRRFGKTLILSMLRYFFEDACDRKGGKVDNGRLFEGLKIMEAGERYTSLMGKYPVISLTFKSGKQDSFESSLLELVNEISAEFRRFEFKVADSIDQLESEAAAALRQIHDNRYDEELRADDYKDIVRYGVAFYKKDCLVVVDEIADPVILH